MIPILAAPLGEGQPIPTQEPDGSTSFKDAFGATLRRCKGTCYYDWQEFPLAEPSLQALEEMPWPDLNKRQLYRGLRPRVLALRAGSDKAFCGMAPFGHDLFNQLLRVRGMENGLMDLVVEVEFAERFLDRLTETVCLTQQRFLSEVGDLIDVHFIGDALAGQNGPMIAPELYRRLIKPRWARIMETIKNHTKAKIVYHSCGALGEFIPDLLEIGVDILNPVQVSAAGMDTKELKNRYGKRVSFWGGGCDTQRVLNSGTPAQVREETRRRIFDLAPGGGFVFNPVHNIQPLVPPENIVAMFNAVREFGRYPIGRAG